MAGVQAEDVVMEAAAGGEGVNEEEASFSNALEFCVAHPSLLRTVGGAWGRRGGPAAAAPPQQHGPSGSDGPELEP